MFNYSLFEHSRFVPIILKQTYIHNYYEVIAVFRIISPAINLTFMYV